MSLDVRNLLQDHPQGLAAFDEPRVDPKEARVLSERTWNRRDGRERTGHRQKEHQPSPCRPRSKDPSMRSGTRRRQQPRREGSAKERTIRLRGRPRSFSYSRISNAASIPSCTRIGERVSRKQKAGGRTNLVRHLNVEEEAVERTRLERIDSLLPILGRSKRNSLRSSISEPISPPKTKPTHLSRKKLCQNVPTDQVVVRKEDVDERCDRLLLRTRRERHLCHRRPNPQLRDPVHQPVVHLPLPSRYALQPHLPVLRLGGLRKVVPVLLARRRH